MVITDELQGHIAETASNAALCAYLEGIDGQINFFRVVETLLYNYKRLEAILHSAEGFMAAELSGRGHMPARRRASQMGLAFDTDRREEELRRDKLVEYERAARNFNDVESMIAPFRDRKQFVVIRMYYLGEDAEGRDRGADAEPYTWDSITAELAERGILKDSKTARRWRDKLFDAMALEAFGLPVKCARK